MNHKKESFILYADTAQHIRLLTDEQAGRLFRLLLDFAADGTSPTPEEIGDNLVALAFSFLSDRIRRDMKKFQDTCEKRREAGRKGAEITNRKRWGTCSDGETPA